MKWINWEWRKHIATNTHPRLDFIRSRRGVKQGWVVRSNIMYQRWCPRPGWVGRIQNHWGVPGSEGGAMQRGTGWWTDDELVWAGSHFCCYLVSQQHFNFGLWLPFQIVTPKPRSARSRVQLSQSTVEGLANQHWVGATPHPVLQAILANMDFWRPQSEIIAVFSNFFFKYFDALNSDDHGFLTPTVRGRWCVVKRYFAFKLKFSLWPPTEQNINKTHNTFPTNWLTKANTGLCVLTSVCNWKVYICWAEGAGRFYTPEFHCGFVVFDSIYLRFCLRNRMQKVSTPEVTVIVHFLGCGQPSCNHSLQSGGAGAPGEQLQWKLTEMSVLRQEAKFWVKTDSTFDSLGIFFSPNHGFCFGWSQFFVAQIRGCSEVYFVGSQSMDPWMLSPNSRTKKGTVLGQWGASSWTRGIHFLFRGRHRGRHILSRTLHFCVFCRFSGGNEEATRRKVVRSKLRWVTTLNDCVRNWFEARAARRQISLSFKD